MPHEQRRVKLALDAAVAAVSGTKGSLTGRNIPNLAHLCVLDLINATVPEVLAFQRAPVIGQLIQNIRL